MNKIIFLVLLIFMFLSEISIVNSINSSNENFQFFTVTSCGIISNVGEYQLINDLSSSSTCLEIISPNVTLDCMGHKITGSYDSNSTIGIITNINTTDDQFQDNKNISIKNCVVEGFGYGIGNFYYGLRDSKVENNTILNNNNGISLDGGPNINITNNIIINNTYSGISHSAVYSSISNNKIYNNLIGINAIVGGSFLENHIYNNVYGIRIFYFGIRVLIVNNIVNNNGYYGIHVHSFSPFRPPVTIHSNYITNNGNYGIISSGYTKGAAYNNFFGNNSVHASSEDLLFNWNTTKINGTNIIGGQYIGGNFWDDYSGQDNNGDDIGDSSYKVGSNFYGDFFDFLPLVLPYLCGDMNDDTQVNLGDIIYLVNYVFKGGPAPVPLAAGDVNKDGKVNLSDIIYLVNYVFKGGPKPCA